MIILPMPALRRCLQPRHRHFLLAAALALPCWASASAPADLAIMLKPLSNEGVVSALEVRQRLSDGLAPGALLRLYAPLALYGAPALADRIADLRVTDAAGAVPLSIENDGEQAGYDTAYRHWQATRPTVFPVTVTYRIATAPLSQNGPPIGMKASGGGVAGSALGFLLLPENTTSRATEVAWDLSELPAGSVGVITSGAGTTVVPGPPSAVLTQWVLAGPARVFNSTRSPRFQAYALGNPPFDIAATMDWADRAFAHLAKSMPFLGVPEYRLFFRALEGPSYATGTARPEGGGALISVGATLGKQSMSELRNTIFHEMTHNWVGVDPGMGAWFVEGLTTYLSAVLPCEAGLEGAQFCADGVNKWATYYYGGVARNWSMAKIAVTVDEDVRVAPYGRGLLYFGQLDAQLRAKSQGRRNLQDALAALFLARSQGVVLDEKAWEAMLLRELGRPAVAQFRASVIDGTATIVPPSNAFGPCLARSKVRLAIKGGTQQTDGYEWHPTPCRTPLAVTAARTAQCSVVERVIPTVSATPLVAFTYAFETLVPVGTTYGVVVQASPPGLDCTVSNGTGVMGDPVAGATTSPVDNVNVRCRAAPA